MQPVSGTQPRRQGPVSASVRRSDDAGVVFALRLCPSPGLCWEINSKAKPATVGACFGLDEV